MKIKSYEVLDVSSETEKTIRCNYNQLGDTVTGEIHINPLADMEITVKGFVGDDDAEGVELKAIDMAGLKKVDSISTAGVYCFVTASYYKVVVTATGSGKLIIKSLY